jgi:hypothetical protein
MGTVPIYAGKNGFQLMSLTEKYDDVIIVIFVVAQHAALLHFVDIP